MAAEMTNLWFALLVYYITAYLLVCGWGAITKPTDLPGVFWLLNLKY